jgi:hypothetical protein
METGRGKILFGGIGIGVPRMKPFQSRPGSDSWVPRYDWSWRVREEEIMFQRTGTPLRRSVLHISFSHESINFMKMSVRHCMHRLEHHNFILADASFMIIVVVVVSALCMS